MFTQSGKGGTRRQPVVTTKDCGVSDQYELVEFWLVFGCGIAVTALLILAFLA